MDGGASPWDTRGKNRLELYHGSRKGKARRFMTPCDSPCVEPEELSPSEGLSLLFRDEEEAVWAVSVGK